MNKKDMIKIFMEMFKEFDDVLEVDDLQKNAFSKQSKRIYIIKK